MSITKTVIGKMPVTRDVHRRVTEFRETPFGKTESIRSVPDGVLVGTAELRIDIEALIRELGVKALGNKALRAKIAGGLVEVVIHKETVRRVP